MAHPAAVSARGPGRAAERTDYRFQLTEWTEQSLSGEAEPKPARFGRLNPVVFSEVVRDLECVRG